MAPQSLPGRVQTLSSGIWFQPDILTGLIAWPSLFYPPCRNHYVNVCLPHDAVCSLNEGGVLLTPPKSSSGVEQNKHSINDFWNQSEKKANANFSKAYCTPHRMISYIFESPKHPIMLVSPPRVSFYLLHLIEQHLPTKSCSNCTAPRAPSLILPQGFLHSLSLPRL